MKIKYKYINFAVVRQDKYENPMWHCLNNRSGGILAIMIYYPKWKQYVMSTINNVVFNDSCLADIQHFLGQLNAELKTKP